MADIDSLFSVFETFCGFGSTRSLQVNATPLLDGSKFAKLMRDSSLLDARVTSTEVDITFNKVKQKLERKISFKQFQEALKLLGVKKYPAKTETEAFVIIVRKINAIVTRNSVSLEKVKLDLTMKTPKSSTTDITARLTDPDGYTGVQKINFASRKKSVVKRSYQNITTTSSEMLGKIPWLI